MATIDSDISVVSTPTASFISGGVVNNRANDQKKDEPEPVIPVDRKDLIRLIEEIEPKVRDLAGNELSFSIVDELSRTVVRVLAAGSGELVRQFPPEEFITVAKQIAELHPDNYSEEVLKGLLFDDKT